MAKPYSEDLRERAFRLVESGSSRRECASLYEVAPSTVIRWMQRFDATGEISAPPMGGARNTRITGSEETWLLALVAAEPDLTIADLRERLRRGRGWSPGMARPEEAGQKPFRRQVIRPRHRVAIRLSQPVSDKG